MSLPSKAVRVVSKTQVPGQRRAVLKRATRSLLTASGGRWPKATHAPRPTESVCPCTLFCQRNLRCSICSGQKENERERRDAHVDLGGRTYGSVMPHPIRPHPIRRSTSYGHVVRSVVPPSTLKLVVRRRLEGRIHPTQHNTAKGRLCLVCKKQTQAKLAGVVRRGAHQLPTSCPPAAHPRCSNDAAAISRQPIRPVRLERP